MAPDIKNKCMICKFCGIRDEYGKRKLFCKLRYIIGQPCEYWRYFND